MAELYFKPPEADAPGYLLRQRKALAFQQKMKAEEGMTPEALDELVDFLAEYVTEPAEPEEKRQALLMASENQFNQLLETIKGETSKKSLPAPKPGP